MCKTLPTATAILVVTISHSAFAEADWNADFSTPFTYAESAEESQAVAEDAPVSFGETPEGQLPEPAPSGTVTVFAEPTRYSYPSVAALTFRHTGPFCTATLIHPEAVLTAAHCLMDDKGRYWREIVVRFRPTRNAGSFNNVVSVSPETVVKYPGTGNSVPSGRPCAGARAPDSTLCFPYGTDLAVVKLTKSVPDAAIRVVPLATQQGLPQRPLYYLVGFGRTYVNVQNGKVSEGRGLGHFTSAMGDVHLARGNLTDKYFSVAGTVRVNGTNFGIGLCNGDSGGPFYVSDSTRPSHQLLAGVNASVRFGGTGQACATVSNTSNLTGVVGNMAFIDAAFEHLGLD